MSEFKLFAKLIQSLANICGVPEEHLYFSQLRDHYSVTYKPNYPGHTQSDFIIQLWGEGYGGDYEFVHYGHGKYHSHYFKDFDDLLDFVKRHL